ncbi:WhiB family transcriptional regulator [Corynebacterium sp. TAE3-ERU16]|nr:WhiB family transcriptional regulator [Corynebacterium sp. TAE3-ERU16]
MPDHRRPPCTRKRAYTDPEHDPQATREAIRTCHTCPLLKDCARQALHGGDSLDGHYTRPATGVIQAGIHCSGDDATAEALARIAGVERPTYRDRIPRPVPPPSCRRCHTPMVPWSRKTLPPPGHVMHHGRGYCQRCRGAHPATMACSPTVDE